VLSLYQGLLGTAPWSSLRLARKSPWEQRALFLIIFPWHFGCSLGPLVRTWDAQIYLVHQSLKDLPLSLSTESTHPLSATFGINPSEASSVLARACISYLLLDNFEHDLYSRHRSPLAESPISETDSSIGKGSIEQFWDSMNLGDDTLFNDPAELEADTCARIAKQYALFDHAARCWPKHFLCVKRPLLTQPAAIQRPSTPFNSMRHHL
jgi:hypothetical protein